MNELSIAEKAKAIVGGRVAGTIIPENQTQQHRCVMYMLYGELLLHCRESGMSLKDFGELLDEIETEVDAITKQHERN